MEKRETSLDFTLESTVGEVINNSSFGQFGKLLFPVDLNISSRNTLREISSSSTYIWYSNIHPEKTVEIVNYLKHQADNGEKIFYPIYTEEEINTDPDLGNTGLFFFCGRPNEKFAIMNAGGGFMYVGAMHDSFPHALEVSKLGYNALALIYRPEHPFEDLARAITFITDHAEELQVNRNDYSLWGGSAGARMAATLGNSHQLYRLTGRIGLPKASAVIMQYTGYAGVYDDDAPTYANVGTRDYIADWRVVKNRISKLCKLGIPTEFHCYDGLSHGFGIGTGTVAEGWILDAIQFWEKQSTPY